MAYTASGDVRPDDALADVRRALEAGAVVVTPAVYALYDQRNAPAEVREPLLEAARAGGASLFVSGVDPGWGNDVLPVLVSGLAGEVDQVRCQEIFDYSTYDAPDAVRFLVGMGEPMDYEPPMVAPGVPTMVWGGQVRMVARALGVELDEVRETLERRPLEDDVTTALGLFERGTQGALRFEVQGLVDGEPVIVVEHVTRIAPGVAPDWPMPPDGGDGAHKVVIEGRPRIEVSLEATDEGGNRAAGGNATAANRLVNAIPWLRTAEPGLYDGLDVPLSPAAGRLTSSGQEGTRMIVDVPEGQDPIIHVWGVMVPGIGPAAATFAQAVYDHTTLGLREFEAARLRIAQINGCLFCQDWRTERDGVKVEDSFPEAVTGWRTTADLDERAKLAAEYAERYALDHHGLDDEFWSRMKQHYSDAEIVELSMCLGSWLSFGRLNRVLGLDTACVLPSHYSKRETAGG